MTYVLLIINAYSQFMLGLYFYFFEVRIKAQIQGGGLMEIISFHLKLTKREVALTRTVISKLFLLTGPEYFIWISGGKRKIRRSCIN